MNPHVHNLLIPEIHFSKAVNAIKKPALSITLQHIHGKRNVCML